jgi:hypothetical protein
LFDIFLNPKPCLFESKRNQAKENKIKSYMSIWPYFQILTYDMCTLLRWFETINKLNLILNEPKRIPFGQRKANKNKNKIKIATHMIMVISAKIIMMLILSPCG